MQLNEIERKIACNEMSPAQVFTQMKQHIKTCLAEHDAEIIERLKNEMLRSMDTWEEMTVANASRFIDGYVEQLRNQSKE